MTTAIDWRQMFQSGAFTRPQAEILRNLLQSYSESVDAAAAPSDAQYLTLAINTTLTAERTFVAGTGLTGVDLGAGNTYTVNLDDTAVTPAAYGSASSVATFTVDQQGRLTAAGSTAISITASQVTDFTEAAQDAIGSAISAGTGDGASLSYSDAGNSISVTNTDKGSAAVATHEAAIDPHPQYLTPAEGAAAYQPLDATLTAWAAYNTNGLLTQTAADTFTGRTITGTANEITATNGNGVSGNPTLSLPSAMTFTGKTVTGGAFNVTTLTTTGNAGIGTASPTDSIGFGRALDLQSSTGACVYVRDSDIGSTKYGFYGADGSAAYVGSFGAGYGLQLWAEGALRVALSAAGADVTGAISATTTIKPGSYTVATLPSAATAGAGALVYCSDETGGAVPVFSDSASWRRVTDRTIAA